MKIIDASQITGCDECGARETTTAEVGEELDYESQTAQLCLPCLRKAVALLEQAEDPK